MQTSWFGDMVTAAARAMAVAALALAGATPASAEMLTASPSEGAALTGMTASPEPGAWTFHIDALEEYRFRYGTAVEASGTGELSTPGLPAEYDHDARLLLQGGVRDGRDAFSAEFSLALWGDLDGRPAAGSSHQLGSMFDADDYFWIDVYGLAAQYRTDGVLALARAGRQTSEFGPPVVFDGAHVSLRAAGPTLEFFAFGGRTVHFFEAGDVDIFEDWIGSAGVVVRPLRGLRFELDYRFLQEDTVLVDELRQHDYGLNAWYRPLDWVFLKAWVRGIDDQVARTGLLAKLEWFDQEAGLTLSADAQPVTMRGLAELDDPYFNVLGESLPHVRARAELYKAFTTDVGVYALHAGWSGRILLDDEPTRFNRDFGRVFLLATASDIGVRGPFVSLVVEYNYTHQDDFGDDGLFAVGGGVGWDRDPIRAELSSYYQRFKYDYFRDVNEVADVRTVAADVRWRPWRFLSVRARYELELRSDRDVHTAALVLAQSW
jgi:hypothetical protein